MIGGLGVGRPYTGVKRLAETDVGKGKIEHRIMLDNLIFFYIPCLLVLGVALSFVKSLGTIRDRRKPLTSGGIFLPISGLEKNQNAHRPFEHPPVRGEKMSKRLGGIKGCKYKKTSSCNYHKLITERP